MRYAIAFALMFFVLPAYAVEYHPKFIQNYDGDTITVEIDFRRDKLRLADVDTPEIKQVCKDKSDPEKIDWVATERVRAMAIRAREFTRTWAMRSDLILTTGKREREKYGRLLGTLTNQDGESLGDKLIEAGLAVRWEGHRHKGWCD
jgi:micrococcal nuclease